MSLDTLALRFSQIDAQIASLHEKFALIQKSQHAPIAKVRSATKFDNPELKVKEGDDEGIRRCKAACETLRLESAKFHYVPSDYYERTLSQRRELLNAPSNDHLCKSMIFENTHCTRKDCEDPRNSRFYMVILQYTRKFNADALTKYVRDMNEGIGKKKFVFRLAEESDSDRLSGFRHNAVTPFGMLHKVPIVLDKSITDLRPEMLWLGGGHVDVKLQLDVEEFIEAFKGELFVADVTEPGSEG